MGIRMGSFDEDPGVRPSSRQFTAYAPPWATIPDDGLPMLSRADAGRRFADRLRDGAEGARTPDLRAASATLFQLSYSPG